MKNLLALAPVLALAACASNPPSGDAPPAAGAGSGDNAVTKAVTSPLNDLNMVQAPIPVVLKLAQKAPYAVPPEPGCEAIAAQVKALDEVLGTDLDAPPSPHNPGLVERGGKELGDAAGGALKSAAEGIVPFRGWVRKLTGAERYSKEVAAAIAAGTVRRAYLKGLGQAQGCAAPAAPLKAPGPVAKE